MKKSPLWGEDIFEEYVDGDCSLMDLKIWTDLASGLFWSHPLGNIIRYQQNSNSFVQIIWPNKKLAYWGSKGRYIVPKKYIIACDRDTLCWRYASLHVPRLHCARSLHRPEMVSSSKFACARTNHVTSSNRFQITHTISSLIIYVPKESSFMACRHHIMD